MSQKQIDISVVVPMLNEEGNVRMLCEKLVPILKTISSRYEIILVDDGSTDGTFPVVQVLATENTNIHGLSLSKNFGHQIALLVGLKHSGGAVVITMDGDMQHPPELIPTLYSKYLAGYDIVNTRRIEEIEISLFKKASSKLFYRLINFLSDVRIEPASADFRLMSRKTVDAFLTIPEHDRFTRGLIGWMGFKQTSVPYQAAPRASGQTKYSLRRMIRFGLNGITAFSARPLRVSFYMGCITSFAGLLYAIYAVTTFMSGATVPGWTSILVSLLIIGGLILINLGIVGEYIARIFKEVKSRPLYFIKDQTDMPGLGDDENHK